MGGFLLLPLFETLLCHGLVIMLGHSIYYHIIDIHMRLWHWAKTIEKLFQCGVAEECKE